MACFISIFFFYEILQGATKLKSLKHLEINSQWNIVNVEGLGKLDINPLELLTSLEVLSLPHLPNPKMNQVLQLKVLNLEQCEGFVLEVVET